ncbi:MAG: methyltransferase domain-containing protein [Desulfobacterales bacterium]|nr:methyltransferase domain-containing protein [Desulfobacterales bacterium]
MDEKRIGLINLVRTDYAKVAKSAGGCMPSSCCGTDAPMPSLLETGRLLGYSDEDLRVGLGEANLGLGCGNPQAVAELKEGEVVLDLGSGAGFDAFLAAMKVGPKGKVIGVDMTPEMVARARQNAIALQTRNVEFRLGRDRASACGGRIRRRDHIELRDQPLHGQAGCVQRLFPCAQAGRQDCHLGHPQVWRGARRGHAQPLCLQRLNNRRRPGRDNAADPGKRGFHGHPFHRQGKQRRDHQGLEHRPGSREGRRLDLYQGV